MLSLKNINLVKSLAGLLFYSCALISADTFSQINVVGKLSGEANVTQGTLNYQFALELPKGIHNNSPDLSISYNPQNVNSVLGVGFSFSASSSISRCTPNKEKDGFESGIQLDASARFCHGSERLMVIAGQNGQNGAEYRTYNNNNAQYLSEGGNNFTPNQWRVNAPSGFKYLFTRQGNPATHDDISAIWFLEKQTDMFGNTMQYHYSNDDVPVLKDITYSGYQINLEYEDKVRPIQEYRQGKKVLANKRLKKVTAISPDDEMVFFYRFTYDEVTDLSGAVLPVDRLSNVTRCYSDQACLKPIQFFYADIPDAAQSVVDGWGTDRTLVVDKSAYTHDLPRNTPMEKRPSFSAGDIDGNGLEDFCYYQVESGIKCTLFEGGNTTSPYSSLQTWTGDLGYNADKFDEKDDYKPYDHEAYSMLRLLDINADGKSDFCITDDQGVRCGLSNGQSFTNIKYWTHHITNEQGQPNILFLNDDHFLDICAYNTNDVYQCFLGNGNNFKKNYRSFSQVDSYEKVEWQTLCSLTSRSCSSTYVGPHKAENSLPPPAWQDIDGDFDKDLCWGSLSREAFTCIYANTNPNTGVVKYSAPQTLFSLNTASLPNIPDQIFKSAHRAYEEQIEDATEITKATTNGFKFANINGDTLIDVCQVEESSNKKVNCRINTGKHLSNSQWNQSGTHTAFTSPSQWQTLNSLFPESGNYEDYFVKAAISSLTISDRNLDGLGDLCIIINSIEHCALNERNAFADFEQSLHLHADIDIDTDSQKIALNFFRSITGQKTIFSFHVAKASYGNLINVSDINNDGYSDLCYRSIWGITCSSNNNYGPTAKLIAFTDSYGLRTDIEYANLLHDNLYAPYTGTLAPGFREMTPNREVVSSIITDTAVQSTSGVAQNYRNRVNYRYGGFVINDRKELSGFTDIRINRIDRDLSTHTKLYANADLFGRESVSRQYFQNQLLKEYTNDYERKNLSNGTYRILLNSKSETQYGLQGELVSTTLTNNQGYDAYGYPAITDLTKTLSTQTGTETLSSTTSATYLHDLNYWRLGLIDYQSVTHHYNGQLETRDVDFVYDKGLLIQEIIAPNSANSVTHSFAYDNAGNVNAKSSQGGSETRHISKIFDNQGRELSVTNALQQTTRYAYHPRCGGVSLETQINGLQVQTTYNDYCEKVKVENLHTADNNSTTWAIEWADSSDNSYQDLRSPYDYVNTALYKITETHASGVTATSYYDAQNRDIKTVASGYESLGTQRQVYTHRVYNQYNQKTAETQPYYKENDQFLNRYWITLSYDALNRPSTETRLGPNGLDLVSRYEYTPSSSTLSYDNYVKTTENGIHGKPRRIIENGIEVSYQYTPIGNLSSTLQNGLETTLSYDSRGFKSGMVDPTMGAWAYTYNAFGQLASQTDAKGQTTQFIYDDLGRKVSRNSPEGNTQWAYFHEGNGIGQLASETGTAQLAQKYWQYDELGRLASETLNIAAQDGHDSEAFVTAYSYDEYGRLDYTEQPNGTKIYNTYDNLGLLKSVALSAEDFQDFNFDYLKEERQALLETMLELQGYRDEALAKAEEHNKLATELEAKRQFFLIQALDIQANISQLTSAASDHRRLSGQYQSLYEEYDQKSQDGWRDYGGKQFTYKKIANGNLVFEHKYCASYHRRVGIRYCHKRRTNTVSIPARLTIPQAGTVAISRHRGTAQELYARFADRLAILYQNEKSLLEAIEGNSQTAEKALWDITASQAQRRINSANSQMSSYKNQIFSILNSVKCRDANDFRCQAANKIKAKKKAGDPNWYLGLNRSDRAMFWDSLDPHDKAAWGEGWELKVVYDDQLRYNEKGWTQIPIAINGITIFVPAPYQILDPSSTRIVSKGKVVSMPPRSLSIVGKVNIFYLGYYRLYEPQYNTFPDEFYTIKDLISQIENKVDVIAYYQPVVNANYTNDQGKALTYNQALAYFNDRVAHFAQLRDIESDKAAAVMNQFAGLYGNHLGLLEDRNAILTAILDGQGLNDENLDELSGEETALADKLVLWQAAMRTPQGDLQSEIFGNGLYTERKINPASNLVEQITTTTALSDGETLRDLYYTFDARGRITEKQDLSTTGNATHETFAYNDSAGRLSDWHFTQQLSMDGDVFKTNDTSQYYEHDATGNMFIKGTSLMDFDPLNNRLTSRTVTQQNGQQTHFDYEYDNNGNMITGDARSYTWASFNKPKSITLNSQTVAFDYDANHKRVRKVSASETRYYVSPSYEKIIRGSGDNKRITHRFSVWNGNDLVASYEKTEKTEAEIQAERDAAQAKLDDATSTSADENSDAIYQHTLNIATTSDSVSYFHRDIIGSGELVTDSNMRVVTRRYYSPYGELVDTLFDDNMYKTFETDETGNIVERVHQETPIYISGDNLNVADATLSHLKQFDTTLISEQRLGKAVVDSSSLRGFTSHESIEEIGLIHMNARLYDPVIGRFVSADSIVPDATTPLDYNRYAYLRGNPVNARDPSGHEPFLIAAALFFAAAHISDNEQLQVLSTALLSAALLEPTGSLFSGLKDVTAAMATAGVNSLTMSFITTGQIGSKDLRNAGLAALSAGLAASVHHDKFIKRFGKDNWAAQTAWHMLSQGAVADLRGDKFISGAVSGFVSKGLGHKDVMGGLAKDYQIYAIAVLGGMASKAAGGDFLNGAITAATVHWFNELRGGAQKGLTQEQINNMSPVDVAKYWKSGKGGHIDFGPDSKMAEIFSKGDGAEYFEKFVLAEHGATPEAGLLVDKFAYTFTWRRALSTLNSAEQAVGSWNNGVAISDGSTITYTVQNRMGANSLMFGRQLNEYFGIETVGKTASDLTMSISWERGY